jgi:hypothetical protein
MKVFEIVGLQELMNAIESLPIKIQASILQSFAKKAGNKFVVNNLRAALPYSVETKEGITTINDRNDKTAIFSGPTSDIFWIRWVERGTKQRTTKGGANRGAITATNRIEPITDSQIEGIIDYYSHELGNEIEKNLKRRIKRIQMRP